MSIGLWLSLPKKINSDICSKPTAKLSKFTDIYMSSSSSRSSARLKKLIDFNLKKKQTGVPKFIQIIQVFLGVLTYLSLRIINKNHSRGIWFEMCLVFGVSISKYKSQNYQWSENDIKLNFHSTQPLVPTCFKLIKFCANYLKLKSYTGTSSSSIHF